jgi:hypothetical protein
MVICLAHLVQEGPVGETITKHDIIM